MKTVLTLAEFAAAKNDPDYDIPPTLLCVCGHPWSDHGSALTGAGDVWRNLCGPCFGPGRGLHWFVPVLEAER